MNKLPTSQKHVRARTDVRLLQRRLRSGLWRSGRLQPLTCSAVFPDCFVAWFQGIPSIARMLPALHLREVRFVWESMRQSRCGCYEASFRHAIPTPWRRLQRPRADQDAPLEAARAATTHGLSLLASTTEMPLWRSKIAFPLHPGQCSTFCSTFCSDVQLEISVIFRPCPSTILNSHCLPSSVSIFSQKDAKYTISMSVWQK